MLNSYKELNVWRKSIELVEEVYILTSQFPKEEIYGLSIQMKRNQGVAALPVIIVIALVILLVGIGLSSSGFIENLSTYGELENKKALSAAEAGAADGFIRLVRNKDCSGACADYTISGGSDDANVDVVITADGADKIITSTGRIGLKRVKIQVRVSFDANGKATQSSWQEIID